MGGQKWKGRIDMRDFGMVEVGLAVGGFSFCEDREMDCESAQRNVLFEHVVV